MFGLKKLDWYIIRQFVGTYVYSILLLSIIIIIFDISEKIDDFTHERAADATLYNIVFDYYLNFIPYFVNQFNALFVFISVIFFTSKLAMRTEIIAILTSGVSFLRLLRPYVITAIALTLFNILMTFWVIPEANKVRVDFENKYIKNKPNFTERNIHLQLENNAFAYFQSFNLEKNTGYQFSLERFENGELTYKLMSTFAKWDTANSIWKIEDYVVREISAEGEKLSSGQLMDTVLPISPQEFKYWENNIETMNQKSLNAFIEREAFKGSDMINEYLVEKYKRLAFPVASIILTLMGFAIASRKVRGGIGVHLGMGIGLCFTYILFSQLFFVYSTQGGFDPLLGVWIPNILYSFITLYLLSRSQR